MGKKVEEFKVFEEEFKRWHKLFGLTGYKVCFEYVPIDGASASISVLQDDMVAIVRLNSKPKDRDRDVKLSAKHEAIHLLISKLELIGKYRYISEGELYEAAEELVHKLEDLLPPLGED